MCGLERVCTAQALEMIASLFKPQSIFKFGYSRILPDQLVSEIQI